ncbi:unnamed protein product, partial [Ectocarpus sp. 4 AP-2014]
TFTQFNSHILSPIFDFSSPDVRFAAVVFVVVLWFHLVDVEQKTACNLGVRVRVRYLTVGAGSGRKPAVDPASRYDTESTTLFTAHPLPLIPLSPAYDTPFAAWCTSPAR